MKIIYHPRYCDVYSMDPASEPGRIEAIRDVLKGVFEFIEPGPATEEDLLLAHTKAHVESIRSDRYLFEVASLAVGGSILAARTALDGEPCLGLIRPPGHHASPGSCWGFCFFNNMAISLLEMIRAQVVKTAVILDFDLHFGDGTENIFHRDANIVYLHPEEYSAEAFVQRVREGLEGAGKRDVLAISAGFDRGKRDWGDLLGEEEYRTIGTIAKEYAQAYCNGRRYALLEGGYNHAVLGRHTLAFLEGFK